MQANAERPKDELAHDGFTLEPRKLLPLLEFS
jgi:hypothetical protein